MPSSFSRSGVFEPMSKELQAGISDRFALLGSLSNPPPAFGHLPHMNRWEETTPHASIFPASTTKTGWYWASHPSGLRPAPPCKQVGAFRIACHGSKLKLRPIQALGRNVPEGRSGGPKVKPVATTSTDHAHETDS